VDGTLGTRPVPAPSRGVVAAYALVTALSVLSTSAVSVVIPQLAGDLVLDTSAAGWVLAAFSVTFPVGTVLFGQLADRLGARRTWVLGATLFVSGGLFAAVSPSFLTIVAGRLVQGVGAGAIPVLTLVRVAVGDDAERASRVGFLTAVVSIHSGAGPLIGGGVASVLGWRGALALPVVALLVAVPIWRDLPERGSAGHRVDWVGAALLLTVIAAPLVALRLVSLALGGPIGLLLVATGIAAALLALRVRRVPDGLLQRDLITDVRLVGAGVAAMCLLAVYLGGMFAVPLLLAERYGLGPLALGVAVLPAAVVGTLTARLIGTRVPPRYWSRAAAASFPASLLGVLLVAGSAAPVIWVLGLCLLAVASMGSQVVLTTESLSPEGDPQASAAISTFQLLLFSGAAFGPVVVGAVAQATSLRVGVASSVALLALGLVALLARRGTAAKIFSPTLIPTSRSGGTEE